MRFTTGSNDDTSVYNTYLVWYKESMCSYTLWKVTITAEHQPPCEIANFSSLYIRT